MTTDRLATLLAAPKNWRCLTTLADGATRHLDCISEAAAYAHREREARKIGRKLIDRETGATVEVVSVEVARKQ